VPSAKKHAEVGMAYAILVVEDNPLNLELARAVLERDGHEVLEAHDATDCMLILSQRRPDLILMDIQLPGKDGLQLTRELRDREATRHLLIVAMTSYAMVGDERRALEAGCDGYLTKPIQTRTLAGWAAAFVEGHRPTLIETAGHTVHREQAS
jgi:CheY-like chemotaxis protein